MPKNEEAIRTTLEAIGEQTVPARTVLLVDDGSPEPLRAPEGLDVEVRRLEPNSGISAARNYGLENSTGPFVAFVNIEVLLGPRWIEACRAYLAEHPSVGVVATRALYPHPGRLTTRWRSRFQEVSYPASSGPMDWLMGHAMMFRREAIEEVGGFDVSRRKAGEDVDICRRLRQHGHEVHFVDSAVCTSIQEDSLSVLAKAEFNRFSWIADRGNGFLRCLGITTNRAFQRSIRHLVLLRWHFLIVEMGLWVHGVRLAWRYR